MLAKRPREDIRKTAERVVGRRREKHREARVCVCVCIAHEIFHRSAFHVLRVRSAAREQPDSCFEITSPRRDTATATVLSINLDAPEVRLEQTLSREGCFRTLGETFFFFLLLFVF